MRVLVTGWPSFRDGEATAGDVLSMRRVRQVLAESDIETEVAFSPNFRMGERTLDDADPGRYSHLVFCCGPAHGHQLVELHQRYQDCHRIAVGVSVIDAEHPAVTGFHQVLARDGATPRQLGVDSAGPRPDLSWSARRAGRTPVVGVVLAPGQGEYGARRRHDAVHQRLAEWLVRLDCARLPLDTRLDTGDWRHCATPDQFSSIVDRLDALVSTRLHGLVLGLRSGLPVIAVDPVAGGGKLSAQAAALGWPAVIGAEQVLAEGGESTLQQWWEWCRSDAGRAAAAHPATSGPDDTLTGPLLAELRRYGRNTEFRLGLQARGLPYVVAVKPTTSAHPLDATLAAPPV